MTKAAQVAAVETTVKAASAKTTFEATAQRDSVKAILESSVSKSAKIRALFADGVSKSEIALILNIRYQHVRNVLLTKLTTQA